MGLQYAKIAVDNSFTRAAVGAIRIGGDSVPRVLFVVFLILAAGLDGRNAVAADMPRPVSVAPLPPPSAVSLSRHSNGELFFDIEDSASAASDRAMRPRRVRVYWDHSASRTDDDLETERDVVVHYLDTVHPGIVDLVLLSEGIPQLRIVEAPQEAQQLAEILRGLRYEGDASSHQILDLELPPADACLYFSDSAVSIDPADAERIRCPLFAISSEANANRGSLRVLARRGSGAYFDLSTDSIDDVVLRLTGSLPRVLSVTSSDGSEIDYALLPSGANRFRIIAPAPKSGEIVITLASGVKRTRTYSVKRTHVRTDDTIGALWAIDRLHELCAANRPDSERIAALAQRYSLGR